MTSGARNSARRSVPIVEAVAVATLIGLAACGDDASPEEDYGHDAADTAREADADAGRDVAEDAGADLPREALDEDFGGTAPCLDPGPGTPDAPVSVVGGAPSLAGGDSPAGAYRLASVEFHASGALSSSVRVFTVHSNGDTRGALIFRDGAWGMAVNLDLYVIMSIVEVGGLEFDMPSRFALAGPVTVADGAITYDSGACDVVVPEGCAIGRSFRYEADADAVAIELVWSQDCLVALMPGSYATYARMWLDGDLPVLLRFDR